MNKLALSATLALTTLSLHAADWNQWRGPNRNGLAAESPKLIDTLPKDGLKPLWTAGGIKSQFEGGWGCPVVADGKAIIFAHEKVLRPGVTLGKAKYPWIAPDKRGNMTDAEYEQYEVNRRNEDEERAKAYIFTETIYAFDALTGKPVYKATYPSVYSRFVQSDTPAIIDGKIYTLGAARTARCYNLADGKMVWESRVPGEFRDEFFMGSPAVAEGVVTMFVDHLVGLDAATGKLLWEGNKRKHSGTNSSAAVWKHEGREYFVVNVGGGETAAVEPKTGKELWRVPSGAQSSTPVIMGDTLITYGSSRKKGVTCYAMSTKEAKKLWQYQGAGDPGSSPVVVGSSLYVQGERRLACVGFKTGQEQWATQLNLKDPRFTSLLAADNKVFYACEGVLCFEATPAEFKPLYIAHLNADGVLGTEETQRRLLNLDALEKEKDGTKKAEQRWRSQVESKGPAKATTPAFWNGKLYIRTASGIVCYDLTASQRT
jgi:outer membrane protein assembly factor BamB